MPRRKAPSPDPGVEKVARTKFFSTMAKTGAAHINSQQADLSQPTQKQLEETVVDTVLQHELPQHDDLDIPCAQLRCDRTCVLVVSLQNASAFLLRPGVLR